MSESAAARYWPGEEPIGKRVRISPRFEWATVVGVAADLRYRELTNNWMTVYHPAPQSFHFDAGNLAIRTERSLATLLPAVRDTIQAIEPAIPIDTLTPLDDLLGADLGRPRLAVRISIARVSQRVPAARSPRTVWHRVSMRIVHLPRHRSIRRTNSALSRERQNAHL